MNHATVPARPSRSVTSGVHPVASRRAVASATSRITSDASGRSRSSSASTSGSTPRISPIELHDVADRRLDPGAGIEDATDDPLGGGGADGHEGRDRIGDVIEVPGRRQEAQPQRAIAAGELRGDGRDHGARRLARPVRVERPQRDDRDAEAQVVALGELVGGDLRCRVRGLRLEWMRLVDRDAKRGAVHLARRGVHDPCGPEVAGRLENVQRPRRVRVEVGLRRAIRVRDPDQRGKVVDDRRVTDELAHGARIADIGRDDLDLGHHLGRQVVEPAPRAEARSTAPWRERGGRRRRGARRGAIR